MSFEIFKIIWEREHDKTVQNNLGQIDYDIQSDLCKKNCIFLDKWLQLGFSVIDAFSKIS